MFEDIQRMPDVVMIEENQALPPRTRRALLPAAALWWKPYRPPMRSRFT